MNLSAPFILRPIMTTLLAIALLAAGLFAYTKLPISNLPDVNYPTITVTAPFPGASPEIMSTTVATPLEKQFMTIPGINNVTSTSILGETTIVLEFDITKDIDLAAVDVNTAIRAARPHLPPNLPQDPTFKKTNPSATPIIYVVVTSPTMTDGKLYDYANTFIGQRISIIDGVSEVVVFGYASAVRAQVDPAHVSSLGITLEDLATSIANQNQYQPLGQFDGTFVSSTIYDNGALYDAEEYGSVIVAYRNGAPVRLRDLGQVVDSVQNDRGEQRYVDETIDQPAIILAIQQQPSANAVKVANAIKELLADLEKQLPASIQLKIFFDRSLSIRESIHDVEFTLILAFILVVLIIFAYLGNPKDTLIPAIVMPLSVIATFVAMYLLGYNLDNLSLLALTLSVGFIIDDAIVVLENIVRHIEAGEEPFEASLEGSRQISFTIVSMTLSLVAVFIPLVFMAGLIGKLFQEFSLTLTIVTIISGIISLTLTPMLSSRFLRPREMKSQSSWIMSFSITMNAWMLGHYKNRLKWAFSHRKTVLLIGAASVVLSLYLFTVLPTDFLPAEDIGFVTAYTEAEEGTSSDQMMVYHGKIVDILRTEPAIQSMISISSTPELRQGQILLSLAPRDKREHVIDLLQDLQAKLDKIVGVKVYLKNIPLLDLNVGTQVRGAYQFLMQSLSGPELYTAAEKLIEKMDQDPIFQAVSSDMEVNTPQINMDFQRDKGATLGVNAENFERALFLSYSGNRISRIQTPIDQYDVILELARELQRDPSSLVFLYLRSILAPSPDASVVNPNLVPLAAVSTWKEGTGAASLNHFAQFPAVTLNFNIIPGIALGDALHRLKDLASESFSEKVTGFVKGAAQTFEEAIHSVLLLLIVTIVVIYVVLGILYESLIHPLTIISTLPSAVVGGLLTLYFTGMPLSLYALLGIILLIGIVKKNGIMMIDFALENIRLKGASPEESIFDACIVRFRPIMMTTAAAIMGAMPIALGFGSGAESRRPLGLVIIGGMLVSQLITLFLTPIVYLYLEKLKQKR